MNEEKMTAPIATITVATISGQKPDRISFSSRSVVRPRARANATGATVASSLKVPRLRRFLLFHDIPNNYIAGLAPRGAVASGGGSAAGRPKLAAQLHQ